MSELKPMVSLRKYLAIAQIFFKVQTAYRFDVAMTAVATVSRILFAWLLWGTIFQSREMVGMFTYQEMLMYYVVSSFLTSIEKSDGVASEVNDRIRGGQFTTFMTRPVNPLLNFVSATFGSSAYYGMFALVAAILSAVVFRSRFPITPMPGAAACALVMIPLGMAFMVCFQFWIGVLAFKFEEVGFFLHLEGNLVQFATGVFIPLALLPDGVNAALRFLPFPYVTYTPAMLLTGRFSAAEGWQGLAILAVWTLGMMLLAQRTYDRMRVRYEGVGV